MALTLANSRTRVDVSLTKPTGFSTGDGVLTIAATAATTGAVPNAIEYISLADFKLGADASDTVDERSLASQSKVTVFGADNYSGNATIFRSYDPTTGLVDPATDTLYSTVAQKGVVSYWWVRQNGRKSVSPLAAGDEGFVYEVLADNAQEVYGGDGYIKATVTLAPQARRAFKITA